MDSKDIEEYVKYASEILDANPQMDEANTKAKLIRDLLELLDWDFATDVELEYPVPMGNQTYKVDYALLLEDTPVVFVEAKGSDSALSDKHRKQLQSYLTNQNIDWGLLTNGQTHEIYQRHIEDGEVAVDKLGAVEIDELSQKSNLLSALSKQSIKTGEAEQIAQKIVERERAKKELRENKEEIAEEVARTVADRVGDSVSKQAENEAKTLVDNLVTELEEEHVSTPNDFWTKVEAETGISKEGDEIVLQADKYGSEQLCDFVAFLYERDYLQEDDLPIELGQSRYLVNTRPVHASGKEMKRPKQANDDLYVETNTNTEQKKRDILELGRRFS